jgi:hypothetical protein
VPGKKLNLKVSKRKFNAAVKNRSFSDPSIKAAEMVMVNGSTLKEAGDATELSTQRVYYIVRELRREVDAV